VNEDKGARYHRLRRQAVIASAAFGAAWLGGLVVSGASVLMARTAERLAAPVGPPVLSRAIAIALFTAILAAGYELIAFPIDAYRGWFLERRYGLSTETLGAWIRDHLKGLALGVVLSIGAALGVFAAAAAAGAWWWLAAAGLFGAAALFFTVIAPIVLLPIFYRFQPLERDSLRARLVALSEKARVPVLGVFEWGLGDKTKRANAALVGVGRTRRILISDTLLNGYSDDEIEVVLAHEMAHHVYGDLWTALALELAVIAAALFAAARIVADPADLASLPLVALVAAAVSIALTPLGNAWSRRNERRADRFALALTNRPGAFISAMRRLGAQNLAEERPSRLVRWLFHSHPTMEERIAAARTGEPR
jgi:STE24 endopeptidase